MHFHSFSYLTEEAECFLWSVQWTWNHLKQTSHLIQNWPSSYVSLHSVQIKFFFSRQIFIFYTTLDFLRGQLDFLCGVFDGAGISFVAFVNFLIFFEAVFDFFFFCILASFITSFLCFSSSFCCKISCHMFWQLLYFRLIWFRLSLNCWISQNRIYYWLNIFSWFIRVCADVNGLLYLFPVSVKGFRTNEQTVCWCIITFYKPV